MSDVAVVAAFLAGFAGVEMARFTLEETLDPEVRDARDRMLHLLHVRVSVDEPIDAARMAGALGLALVAETPRQDDAGPYRCMQWSRYLDLPTVDGEPVLVTVSTVRSMGGQTGVDPIDLDHAAAVS
ncbi:MAG: hypothetical protein Q4G51_11650 [Dermatophilus congolensis]|nr:hypothetical protein [Dermatophilus congolensis]